MDFKTFKEFQKHDINQQEIFDRWTKTGFVNGLNKDEQQELSLLFELIAKEMIALDDNTTNQEKQLQDTDKTATYIFPIVRRLFVIQKHIEDLWQNPTELIKRVDKHFEDKQFEEMSNEEAEWCLSFCKQVCDEAVNTRKV